MMLMQQWVHKHTHTFSFCLSLWRSSQASIPQLRKIPWPDGPGPRPDSPLAPGVNQALSCFLPFVFLLCSIFRPVLVRIRLRNPCLRMRISRDGRFMFMYRRGPQRICEPTPTSAGFDVIAVLGTTSAAVVAPTASAVVVGAAAAGVKALGMRRPAAGLRAKMLGDAAMLGRRVGREEKDLVGNAVRQSEIPTLSRGQEHGGRTSSWWVVVRHLGRLRGARTAQRAATLSQCSNGWVDWRAADRGGFCRYVTLLRLVLRVFGRPLVGRAVIS